MEAFLRQYHEQHHIEKTGEREATLTVGKDNWPLPIPLLKGESGWRFDIKAGDAELRTRRIGRNELDAQQAVLTYHDAQMDYATVDRDGDGALEYAQRSSAHPASTMGSIGRKTTAGRSAHWGRCSAKVWPAKAGTVITSAS